MDGNERPPGGTGHDEGSVPPEIDITKPSIARVYDYLLGGKDNFAVDRQMAEAALKINPEGRDYGVANRAFLRRAVRHMAVEGGVRQFLDIGSGLPTRGNVHEIVQEVDPGTRVVYVDNDPIVLAHGRALLATNEVTTVIGGDLRRPQEILDNPEVRRIIDFDRPVGLLFIAVLHHINDDEDPWGLVGRFRAVLAPGSFVAVSHFFNPMDEHPEASRTAFESEADFNKNLGTGRWRTRKEIAAYFGDMELVEPGLVRVADWRPEPDDIRPRERAHHTLAGAVARVP